MMLLSVIDQVMHYLGKLRDFNNIPYVTLFVQRHPLCDPICAHKHVVKNAPWTLVLKISFFVSLISLKV